MNLQFEIALKKSTGMIPVFLKTSPLKRSFFNSSAGKIDDYFFTNSLVAVPNVINVRLILRDLTRKHDLKIFAANSMVANCLSGWSSMRTLGTGSVSTVKITSS